MAIMSGESERRSSGSDDQKQEDGISVLDLESLPPTIRKIMRLMLRKVEITYPDLCEAVEALPEADRLSRADLDEVLDRLIKQRWLIRMGTDRDIAYKVNLRRKAGSTLSKSIWDAMDSTSEPSKRPEQPDDKALDSS
jgi:predicted transcriptional regulator